MAHMRIPLFGKKAVTKGTDLTQMFGGVAKQGGTRLTVQENQLKAYTDWVYAAASRIAQDIAAIQLELYVNRTSTKNQIASQRIANDPEWKREMSAKNAVKRVTKDGKEEYGAGLERVDNHPLLDLLHSPNAFMTKDELFELLAIHMLLAGEGFWTLFRDKYGTPAEIWPLMPNLVDIAKDSTEFIKGYVYNIGGKKVPLEPNDVIHFKLMNPNDFHRGMSVVRAAARAIDTDTSAADFNKGFFKRGAKFDGVLEADEILDPDVFDRLREQWSDEYGGTDNAGKTPLLQGGVKYKAISLSQKDMDFLEGRRYTRDEIFAIFNTPPSIVGITENANRAVAEAAEYTFAKRTIKPKMQRIVSRITEDLAVQFDPKLVVTFKDPVPEDKEYSLNERRAAVNSWMTIDEVRALQGLDPLPNKLGETLYQQGTLVPVGYEPPAPAPVPAPPLSDQSKMLKEIRDEISELRSKKKFIYDTPEERADKGESFAQEVDKASKRGESAFLKASRAQFDKQKEEVLKNLKKGKAVRTFAPIGKVNLPNLFDFEKAVNSFLAAYVPIYKSTVKEAADHALLLLGTSGFDMEDPAVAKYFDTRPQKIVTDINQETERQLKATLTEGINAGESTDELAARVEDVYGAAAGFRAERIARTEMVHASSFATEEAWTQSEEVEAKEWYTTQDSRLCEFCADMDGKIVGLGDSYWNKGDVMQVTTTTDKGEREATLNLDYEDIDGPPLHAACRCVLLPVLK